MAAKVSGTVNASPAQRTCTLPQPIVENLPCLLHRQLQLRVDEEFCIPSLPLQHISQGPPGGSGDSMKTFLKSQEAPWALSQACDTPFQGTTCPMYIKNYMQAG
jgi:hypothetical protein